MRVRIVDFKLEIGGGANDETMRINYWGELGWRRAESGEQRTVFKKIRPGSWNPDRLLIMTDCYYLLACATTAAKACGSFTARSASILRLRVMRAFFMAETRRL